MIGLDFTWGRVVRGCYFVTVNLKYCLGSIELCLFFAWFSRTSPESHDHQFFRTAISQESSKPLNKSLPGEERRTMNSATSYHVGRALKKRRVVACYDSSFDIFVGCLFLPTLDRCHWLKQATFLLNYRHDSQTRSRCPHKAEKILAGTFFIISKKKKQIHELQLSLLIFCIWQQSSE